MLQAISTAICVVSKSLKTRQIGFGDRSSPSANTSFYAIGYFLLLLGAYVSTYVERVCLGGRNRNVNRFNQPRDAT